MPRKGAHARAVLAYPAMTVLAGSVVAEPEVASMPKPYSRLRQRLIDTGVITRIGKRLVFTLDWRFDSASEAVCVVQGGSQDGYRSWKNGAGQTLSDLGYRR